MRHERNYLWSASRILKEYRCVHDTDAMRWFRIFAVEPTKTYATQWKLHMMVLPELVNVDLSSVVQ